MLSQALLKPTLGSGFTLFIKGKVIHFGQKKLTMKINVIERKIKPEEMKEFVGCFLTGTAAEVTPVSQINEYKFKVCNLISSLNDDYQKLVRKDTAA